MKLFSVSAIVASLAVANGVNSQGMSGSHTDIPRWCGKPYMAGSPNYNPGGMLFPPKPAPSEMLYVQVEPRYSIYVSSETTGEFIVDAALSKTHGAPFSNVTYMSGSNQTYPFGALYFDIRLEETDQLLVSSSVPINSTDAVFEFDLITLTARMHAYNIVLYGGSDDGGQSFTAITQLFYLPAKTNGSMVKIDNLNGGMLVANNVSDYDFEPILSYGFYTDCSGYLNLSFANVEAYYDMGFNAINPVCAYTDGDLDFLFDEMDQINLLFQYDMRGSFMNLTSVAEQIPLVKDHSSFLSYYTADEPDGWQYPLNSTRLAYDLIASLDKYHPVGLVLNCENYYFKQYTSGADYIMEDAYPIGINATYSIPWNTTCNITYGDCGCDDCVGELQDVSHRLDSFVDYQSWLGQWPKPLWAVPQSFSGEGYWSRDPTVDETWVMNALAFNHKAKAIMLWTFPTTPELATANGQMAKVVTVAPVSTFLLGDQPTGVTVKGHSLVDVAYWIVGKQVMVSVVNLDYADTTAEISIALPVSVSSIASQPWGSLGWSLVGNSSMQVKGLVGLATSMVILDV